MVLFACNRNNCFSSVGGVVVKKSYLKQEHDIYRTSLRRFLEKEAIPHLEMWKKQQEVPRTFWKKLGQNGFLCPQVDEAYGGLNADFGFAVVSSEEFDRVSEIGRASCRERV